MILKDRKMPIKLKKLQALLRRIPDNHIKRPQIESEHSKLMAGYRGEQSIDYYLNLLPENQYNIFHDLRLQNGANYFQIDTLIITMFFLLIIEVKNIAGTLHFDYEKNQLVRSLDGKETGFPDPFLQVFHQKLHLEKWLLHNKFTKIPIDHFVVISNPSTIIKTTQAIPELIHNANLTFKIQQLSQGYTEQRLSKKELRKLASKIVKQHTPSDSNILKQFLITEDEILKGVFCNQCSTLGMKRLSAKWVCLRCNFLSKNAHLLSLNDYALLIKSTITNQQLREFLQIPSRSTSTNLLNSMQLDYSGSTKGRVYELSLDEI